MEHPQVRALINSVMVNGIKFNEIECELFKILRELFEQMLKAVLDQVDNMVKYSALRQGWEIKDMHQRTKETVLGQITYKRRYYKRLTVTGKYIYSYLLDEVLGIEKGKNLSPRLAEMAASQVANMETSGALEIYNSYWLRRQADGIRRTDPSDWCRGHMPGMYGPSSKEREMANLISRLTLGWLF